MIYYGWIIVLLCFLLLFVVSGVNQTFSVYFSSVLTEFGWNRASVSLALSIFMLVSAVTIPIFGKLIDKYGPKRVILACVSLMGLSTLLLGRTNSLLEYYLLYGLGGISFSGAGFLPTTVLVSRWFYKKRTIAMSTFLSGYPFSQIVLVPLSSYLITTYGWRTSYIIFGSIFLAIILPLLFFFLKENPEELGLKMDGETSIKQIKHSKGSEIKVEFTEAIKTPSFLALMAVLILCGITDVPITAHFAPFVRDLGFSSFTAVTVFSLMGVFVFMGTIVMGPISNRFGRKKPISTLYLIRSFSLLLILGHPDINRLYASAILFGFSYFSMSPLISAWLADNYGSLALGKLRGITLLIHSISASVGTFFLGFVFDVYTSYYWGIFVLIILSCLASFFAFLIQENNAFPLKPV